MPDAVIDPTIPELPYTLHIVLATTPLKDQAEYISKVEEQFYENYKKETNAFYDDQNNVGLYQPIKYYLFGHYDVAFISVIDSFKFAQKLFIPDNLEVEDTFNPNSFQVITGVSLLFSSLPGQGQLKPASLPDFFSGLTQQVHTNDFPLFLSIINLKINNGLLIGNGNTLLGAIVHMVDDVLKTHCNKDNAVRLSYVILQSFSWHELNIVCFVEDLAVISTILHQLRILTLGDLPQEIQGEVFSKSLYGKNTKKLDEPAKTLHLFLDTQTYLGLDYSVVKGEITADIAKRLTRCEIETETEWKVKPGYGGQLHAALKQHGFGWPVTKEAMPDSYVVTGKTDYLMPAARTKLLDSVRLFHMLLDKDNAASVTQHVRKIKTRVLIPAEITASSETTGKPDYLEVIQKLKVQPQEIAEVNNGLKRQKVSHQLRNKVKRILYIYNSEIQDHILFPYFLDFHWFIRRLVGDCRGGDPKTNSPIPVLEKKLIRYIKAFEEGHRLRVLNSYQFEEVNDFDLDFSASIQQLLSIYHAVVLNVSGLFYPGFMHCPVVQLNWSDSVANVISINYNIHHLLSPEFIFSTIAMDILTPNFSDREISPLVHAIKKKFDEALAGNTFLQQYKESNLIDFINLLTDAVRFVFTFNAEPGLFRFWLWSYNFQNPALFNDIGSMDESYFKAELFRYTFIYELFGFGDRITEESCPLPEIQTYWSRYYFKTHEAIKDLLNSPLQLQMELGGKKRITLKPDDTTAIVLKKFLCFMLLDPIKIQISPAVKVSQLRDSWKNKLDPNGVVNLDDRDGELEMFEVIGSGGATMGEQLAAKDNCIRLFYKLFKDRLTNGQPIFYDEKQFCNPNIFIASMMYTSLSIIAEKNGYEVRLLRRDWISGKPMKLFIENTEDHIYSVDPLGSIFFSRRSAHHTYFILRNALLKSLCDFMQVQKKIYIDHLLKPQK